MDGIEFSDIQRFMAIAEHGSFTRAAASLNLTGPALSQSLKSMEQKLGAILVNRTTRVVSLTEAGVELAWRLRPAMDEIRLALNQTSDGAKAPSGILRVHAMRHASRRYIEPNLKDFADAFPAIRVEVTIGDTPVDIIQEGYDVSLCLGEMLNESDEAVSLGPRIKNIAAAAPSYLKRYGHPSSPAMLHHHRCITWYEKGAFKSGQWDFLKDGQLMRLAPNRDISFSDPRSALEAAAYGAGIVYWAEDEIQPYIDEGLLMPILMDWSVSHAGFYLCFPKSRLQFAAPRAFIEFMTRRTRKDKKLYGKKSLVSDNR